MAWLEHWRWVILERFQVEQLSSGAVVAQTIVHSGDSGSEQHLSSVAALGGMHIHKVI